MYRLVPSLVVAGNETPSSVVCASLTTSALRTKGGETSVPPDITAGGAGEFDREVDGEGGTVGGGVRCKEGCVINDANSNAKVESSDASAKNDKCCKDGRDCNKLASRADSDQHDRGRGVGSMAGEVIDVDMGPGPVVIAVVAIGEVVEDERSRMVGDCRSSFSNIVKSTMRDLLSGQHEE